MKLKDNDQEKGTRRRGEGRGDEDGRVALCYWEVLVDNNFVNANKWWSEPTC